MSSASRKKAIGGGKSKPDFWQLPKISFDTKQRHNFRVLKTRALLFFVITASLIGLFFTLPIFKNMSFVANALSISGLSVNSGSVDGGNRVVINGSNFQTPLRQLEFDQIVTGGSGLSGWNTGRQTCAVSTEGKAYCWGSNSYGQLGIEYLANTINTPTAIDMSGVLSGKTIKQISIGHGHACAIASDDKVYCWGRGINGQLGNGSSGNTVVSAVPVAVRDDGVLAGKTIKQIAAGVYHTCALDSDGQVYCWGHGNVGQLGRGSTADSNIPVAVNMNGALAGKTIKQISAGVGLSCAIASDDRVYCWGYNNSGQLGIGNTSNANAPVAVNTSGVLAGKTIKQVSAGYYHVCVLDSDSLVYCWGHNSAGQMGDNTSSNNRSLPVATNMNGALAGKTIKQISSGDGHTCAVASDDRVYCWGYNNLGQLGVGNTSNANAPVAVNTSGVLAGKTIKQVSAGYYSTCALDSDGKKYCWGGGDTGALGNGANANSNVPAASLPVFVNIPNSEVKVGVDGVELDAASVYVLSDTKIEIIMPAHTAGSVDIEVKNPDGTSFSLANAYTYFARNDHLPMINSIVDNQGSTSGGNRVLITGERFFLTEKFKDIEARNGHSCGISLDNQVYCWGQNNTYGQLGNGSSANSNVPVAVKTDGVLAGKTIKQISGGDSHTCVIASDDQVYCWGLGTNGQLGNGSSANSNVPVAVKTDGVLAGKTIKSISSSVYHTCVIASDNRVYCWGMGHDGRLGDGNSSNSNVPVAVKTDGVLAGKAIKQVSSGYIHTCALDFDNRVYCWGANNYNQLGNGTTTTSSVPVAVLDSAALNGKVIRQIRSANGFNCVLASDDQVYCWGWGANGRLGNGTTTNSSIPVSIKNDMVLAGKTIKQISGDSNVSHTCVIDSEDKAYCWGLGTNGQLGHGTAADSSVPVAVKTDTVLAGKSIKKISSGYHHTCAVTFDDRAYCWGKNEFGQIGVPGTANILAPTQVSTNFNINPKIKFGDSVAVSGEMYSYSHNRNILDVLVPAHVAGVVNVAIASGDGVETVANGAYTYIEGLGDLRIDNISPSFGLTAGGNTVTISGDGLGVNVVDIHENSSCVLVDDGRVLCTGANNVGQLGQGHNNAVTGYVYVKTALRFSKIVSINNTTCGLTTSGEVYCWGSGSGRRTGSGAEVNRNLPTKISSNLTFSGLSGNVPTGRQGAFCAIEQTSGWPYCWGDGETFANSVSNPIIPLGRQSNGDINYGHAAGKRIKQVVFDRQNVFLLDEDGVVYSMGSNNFANLGIGSQTRDLYRSYPVKVHGINKVVTRLVISNIVTCVVYNDATLPSCWGWSYYNQWVPLGQGGPNSFQCDPDNNYWCVHTPRQMNKGAIPSGVAIRGMTGNCILTSQSKIYCWLGGTDGFLAPGNPYLLYNRGDIPVGANLVSLGKHDGMHCVGDDNNKYYCWSGIAANAVPRLLKGYLPEVKFDNNTSATVNVINNNTLTAVAPAHAAGLVDVTVSLNGRQVVKSNAYNYADGSTPLAPTGFTASPSVSTVDAIDLVWMASNDGGLPITDYIISFCFAEDDGSCLVSPSGDWQVYNDGVNTNTNATVSGLPASPSGYYSFRVKARNQLGDSPDSNIATAQLSFLNLSNSVAQLSFDVLPSGATNFSSNKHILNIKSSGAYRLMLSTNVAHNNLVLDGDSSKTISATSASLSDLLGDPSYASGLSVNTWGYSLDKTHFGNTNQIETNVAQSAFKWVGVPALSNPDNIHSSSTPTSSTGANLDVYYGMNVDRSIEAGRYQTTVVYTLVAQ